MKRDVIFLCQFTYPEYVSSAVLPFDTAKHLVANGFTVDVLSGYPREYSKENKVPTREIVDGVSIRRVHYIQMSRAKRFSRYINYFSFTISVLFHLPMIYKYKSIVVYSNPPVLPVIAILSNVLFKSKIVFVAYDVYPEIAYASENIIPGDRIDRVMKWINNMLYRRVNRVVALTDEMNMFIANRHPEISLDKIVTISNWAHENTKRANRDAYNRFGYTENDFIVSYFGNMGVCQDMETLINAMILLNGVSRIQFLIIGHGSKKEYLQRVITDNNLQNVQLLDYLIGDDFEQAVAISSCCVVSLEKGLIGTSAPSKYYSYLKGGKPVLAIVESGSYLQVEVESEGIGSMVRNGDAHTLAKRILEYSTDSNVCSAMGERALDLYKRKYDKKIGLRKYKEMFADLISYDAS